ncbi:MAG: hypothetical protein ABSE40_00935 [Candidatus Sulfotelmatobacter sp.]|jgi:hypothetical protein
MKRIPVLAVMLITSWVSGQVDHAPTVAQCQADQRLWLSKIEAEGARENLPPFDVLGEWNREMLDCQKVDPAHAWNYSATGGEIVAEHATRLVSFLVRHQLWQQFKEEDAAGKR